MSTSNYRKCENCGAMRDANDLFCGNCGKPFNTSGENNTTPPLTGLKQSPITPKLYDSNNFASTQLASNSTSNPSSRSRSNKIYLVVIAVLLIMLVGAGFFLVKENSQGNTNTTSSSSNLQGISQAKTTPTVGVSTPTIGTTSTQTSPSPTTNAMPTPGTILYQTDQSWSGWSGSNDWQIANGMLINNGIAEGGGPTIVAPYEANVSDYAVEATIQVVHWKSCCIAEWAMVMRASSNGNNWQGYSVGDDIASFAGPQYIAQVASSAGDYSSSLQTAPFDPGSAFHTYRVEVKGNRIRLLIDGGVKLDVTDNSYLTGGQVGLWSFGVQLDISSFKIIALYIISTISEGKVS